MASVGTIICRTYTSRAMIPLENVTVIVTQRTGGRPQLLAIRKTDRSGLTVPIAIDVPDAPQSADPAVDAPPQVVVALTADATGYERITVEGVQVFAGIVTEQNFAMIPLAEFPEFWTRSERFDVPLQNL